MHILAVAECYLLSKRYRDAENPSIDVDISTPILGFSTNWHPFESR
ncbi:hypothetical protein BIFBRE_04497 [Bifidobacterium breve DSM 20213 = JCM 1192]|jgi:hypothetical protein|uniref:Uncharacterized protein n=1 Tax=Bifidobacterium breve DSM 20213 = JCM 1192 TaxID=518634 RepID=D4BQW8_BIFBR|nr:hypothetical protein BIFBRE_04497 [Bifidobacterium breve DSM 20213 = JCM 1192]